MIKIRISPVVLACLLFLNSNILYAEVVDMITARVNDKVILLSDIRIRMAQMLGPEGIEKLGEDKRKELEKKILDSIIEEKLIVEYATSQGVTIEEEEIDKSIAAIKSTNNLAQWQLEEALEREGITKEEYREVLKNQKMMSMVLSQEISSKVFVDEKEIKQYYQSHSNEFMSGEERHVRHILFLSNSSMSEEKNIAAQKKAEDVFERIKKGEEFIELAKLYSEDGSASSGGDLGFFPKGKMIKDFEEVAFKLKVGEVSPVLKTEFGYHILKCEGTKPARVSDFSEAEPVIREKLFSEKAEIRKKALIDKLKKDSIVELHL